MLNIPTIIPYSTVYLETGRIKYYYYYYYYVVLVYIVQRARVRARVPPDHVEFVTLVLQTHIIIIIITWGKCTTTEEKKNYYNNNDNDTYRWAMVDVTVQGKADGNLTAAMLRNHDRIKSRYTSNAEKRVHGEGFKNRKIR